LSKTFGKVLKLCQSLIKYLQLKTEKVNSADQAQDAQYRSKTSTDDSSALLLLEKEDRLRVVLDNIDASIWVIDTRYGLVDFNKHFAESCLKYYGVTLIQGHNILDYSANNHNLRNWWKARYDLTLQGKAGVYIDSYTSDIIAELKMFPIYKEGQIVGAAVFAYDITATRKAEKELREAKEKAEAAKEAKTRFLSAISHEIRTPLNAVIGFANLLETENLPPEQIENIEALRTSAEHLQQLVNDVLDFNKTDDADVIFEQIEFSVQDIKQSLLETFMAHALDKEIQLLWIEEGYMPEFVIGDPTRLAQILHNLLSNAIKFTLTGQVHISLKMTQKTQKDCLLEFTIQDTGIGIAPDRLLLIFDTFTYTNPNINAFYGGSGLGLSLTKRLVELQGGHIQVESRLGIGSKFTFHLPFGMSKRKKSTKSKKYTAKSPKAESLLGRRVLLAEDNLLNRKLVSRYLNKWQMQVDYAENGLDAFEKVDNCPADAFYEIILMDLQMPMMDGYKASQHIRSLPEARFQAIPIIALTASDKAEVRIKSKAAGINDYVMKPFEPAKLQAMLLKYITENEEKHTHLSKEPSESINYRNIVRLAGDDLEYEVELRDLYVKFLQEFKGKYSQVMSEQNLTRLKSLIHKSKPSIIFLELKALQEILNHGEELLTKGSKTNNAIDKSIRQMEQACAMYLAQLQKYA
jgi:PAS domain S-box-containing protein